ncbi:ABC transporter substrate-binding protein [Rhodovastum atsumiense]|uniref:ABC transporter substrate-binding protein n=2 Tax=Rhodovastum atsumiense TaxID=504468 RepID=A0A5M6IUQ7_9PROT|nr:ABC transporter substrate-binding protein [Rhodovastum atsumiense]KAA5611145.1 ABC transporter substrate-binding protein [Rhodovastum atsumiense]
MKTNRMGAIAGAAMLACLLGGQAQAKTLVYCSEGSPENFNPMLNTTGTTFNANLPIYNRLTEFRHGSTEVEPGLAEKWDVSDDGRVFTFHLRHNVKWHSNKNFKPTRNFNADDVIFSFERQWKDSNPYHKVSGGGYDYFADMGMPKLLESIERVDDYTVKFTLKEPQAPFLANLAMDFASIQSKEYADALLKLGKPELIDQEPIGTGPFEFVAYQKDSTIRYRAFAPYWHGKPKLDALVFSITKDPAVRLAKLRANECQVMPYPNPADLESIRQDPKLQLLSQPGLNIGYLAFNNLKAPFTDKRVRQAINYAIDKKAILTAIYQGAGTPAKNLIPPTLWGYNDQVPEQAYDPAKARALLAEAGFPNGFETTLWAMPVQRPYNPDARRMAELIQADLAKIGVKASIVSYEWGEYRKRLQNAEHGLALFGWTGDNGDPDNFFTPLAGCDAARIGGGSVSKWCNQDFEALIRKAAQVPVQAERAKLYQQAQLVMREEQPFFLVAHSVVFWPVRKEVVGFKMSPFGRVQFEPVDLK